jgi:hypothetical protein
MASTTRTTRTRPPEPEPEPELVDEVEDDDLFGDEDDEDEFDDARSGFVKQDDLEDRLLLVYAHEIGERESTLPGQSGKMYNYVVTTAHVLSGQVEGLIDEVPMVLEEFQFSGINVVGQLKPKIRSKRPLLGVLTRRPAQKRGMQDSWVFEPPTDQQKARARKYIAALKAKRQDDFDV